MDQKHSQKTSSEHLSEPMVPDLDFLMAMVLFREDEAPDPANWEEII